MYGFEGGVSLVVRMCLSVRRLSLMVVRFLPSLSYGESFVSLVNVASGALRGEE